MTEGNKNKLKELISDSISYELSFYAIWQETDKQVKDLITQAIEVGINNALDKISKTKDDKENIFE